MNALMPLIEQVLTNGLLSKKPPFMRKNKFGLGLMALSGFFFLMACVFMALSFYGWLLTQYTQPVAALITAVAVLLDTVFFAALGAYLVTKKRTRQAHVSDNEMTRLASEITDIIAEELAEPIQENPKTAMALAGLAGFMVGDHLH